MNYETLNPHEIFYRIYYEFDYKNQVYKDGLYRLVEMDGWDEFHQVDILRDATLENILMVVDLLGGELENRKEWEYGLRPY